MTAAGIATNDTTFATNLMRGQAGTFANSIATNASRMTSLRNAGYPANLFMVNPTVVNGGAFLVTNGGAPLTTRCRSKCAVAWRSGLLVQGSYAWSKSMTNMLASDSAGFSQPTTFRSALTTRGRRPGTSATA